MSQTGNSIDIGSRIIVVKGYGDEAIKSDYSPCTSVLGGEKCFGI